MSVLIPNPVLGTPSTPTFGGIARELRVQIYKNVFGQRGTQAFYITSRMPAVIRIAHPYILEARRPFFETYTFHDSVDRLDFSKLITWLEDIISTVDAADIRAIRVHILSIGT